MEMSLWLLVIPDGSRIVPFWVTVSGGDGQK